MCRTEWLHAMSDDEKMEEDKEENGNEEIGDEGQEDEHKKARVMASPEIPSRREVEITI